MQMSLNIIGASELATEIGAISADHLMAINEKELKLYQNQILLLQYCLVQPPF